MYIGQDYKNIPNGEEKKKNKVVYFIHVIVLYYMNI